ncbi:hypothetical protein FWD07_01140 [Candidatus Saccharibacteria bacterium]|nr:hypothetical protein [Candidatus Saccharibacteria bacterium]
MQSTNKLFNRLLLSISTLILAVFGAVVISNSAYGLADRDSVIIEGPSSNKIQTIGNNESKLNLTTNITLSADDNLYVTLTLQTPPDEDLSNIPGTPNTGYGASQINGGLSYQNFLIVGALALIIITAIFLLAKKPSKRFIGTISVTILSVITLGTVSASGGVATVTVSLSDDTLSAFSFNQITSISNGTYTMTEESGEIVGFTWNLPSIEPTQSITYRADLQDSCVFNLGEIPIHTINAELGSGTYNSQSPSVTFSTKQQTEAPANAIIPIFCNGLLELIGSNEVVSLSSTNRKYTLSPESSYILLKDLDLVDLNWTPLPTFSGVFDGNNHAIDNMTINTTGGAGLFSGLDGGTVKNLAMTNVDITATVRGGGSITGGMTNGALIENSFADVTMDIVGYGGGLTGLLAGGSIIRNSYAIVDIQSDTTGFPNLWSAVGGLAGWSAWAGGAGYIENSFATGTITSTGAYTGGLLGYNEYDDNIINSYSFVTVLNGWHIGRIQGAGWRIGVNNHAYEGILVNSNAIATGTTTNYHGQSITFSDATTQTHFETIGLWGFDANGPWTFNHTNVASGTNLPILQSFINVTQRPNL